MSAPVGSRVALLLAVGLSALATLACRSGERPELQASGTAAAPAAPASSSEAPAPSEIRLLFPGPDDDFLHIEKRSVLPIESPEERAKQCLEELFRGPAPSPGLLAAVPDGVRVRQVYILPSGTAYADLSAELLKHQGGSLGEVQTIYAIVDTLAINVPQIKRIAILVNGQTRQTLAGHIFMAKPLTPDFQYVEESARPATTGEPPGTTPGEKPGEGAADGTSGDEQKPDDAAPAPGDSTPETPSNPSVSDTV